MEIPEKIKEKFLRKLTKRFRKLHWFLRILLFIIGLFGLIFTAKIGIYGDTVKKSIDKIIPLEILDCNEDKLVNLNINFQVNNLQGKVGDNYKSGDKITLQIQIDTDSHILILGIDKNGVYPVINNSLAPFLYKSDKLIEKEIILDKTTGREVFYVIGSDCPFSYSDIDDKLNTIKKGLKGIETSQYDLDINQYYDYIYFNHIE